MDALKPVLSALRMRGQAFNRLLLQQPWGMQLGITHGAAFHVVEEGHCWLRGLGLPEPLRLEAGDLVIVANTEPYEIVDCADGRSVPLAVLLEQRLPSGEITLGSGMVSQPVEQPQSLRTTLICGQFRPENEMVNPLFSLLPSYIFIPGQQGQSVEWLASSLRFIALESNLARPGSETVISRLMDILLIMVLRYWIDHQSPDTAGWLGALYHPQVGRVLALMHQQPERDWTVIGLADAVGLPRSTLAAQFTALVGEAPMKYLTRWRMQLAALQLTDNPNLGIETVASHVGYRSAFAFSKAFKRLIGIAPSDYRRSVRVRQE